MNESPSAVKSLEDRLNFIGLDAGALQRLSEVQTYVDKHLPIALDLFYKKIATVPQVSKFFSGQDQMKRAGDSQIQHWRKIAAGRFDLDYVEATSRIGLRHAKIGLEPRWYVGGYGVIIETLVKGVVHDFMVDHLEQKPNIFGQKRGLDATRVLSDADSLAAALAEIMKAVMVDIDYAVSTYFDKMTADAAELTKHNADKVMLAVTETGNVLQKIADGDLTERVQAEFDPSLQKLKDDTNARQRSQRWLMPRAAKRGMACPAAAARQARACFERLQPLQSTERPFVAQMSRGRLASGAVRPARR